MNLSPDRMRRRVSAPATVHPSSEILAGYSTEMLETAIRELSGVVKPGEWEVIQLSLLKGEKERRASALEGGKA